MIVKWQATKSGIFITCVKNQNQDNTYVCSWGDNSANVVWKTDKYVWNEGTITFQAFFTANSTNTGTTAWGLAGVALADDGSLNTAFGTTVVATAKAHSGTANDLNVTAESGAVTIAGSPSTDEYVFFQIQRDVSADDLTADAKLLGVKLFFTTDALNDA